MPTYRDGKIYAIRCQETDDVYIGSTTQKLSCRMTSHRSEFKREPKYQCASRQILQYPSAYIELVEDYPCDNKEQLNRREGEVMRSMTCVNKAIPLRTQKEYREDNKEWLDEYHKKYREDHREELRVKQAEIRAKKHSNPTEGNVLSL